MGKNKDKTQRKRRVDHETLKERVVYARSFKKLKTDEERKVPLSITLIPQHVDTIKALGNGVYSHGIAILVERYLKEQNDLGL